MVRPPLTLWRMLAGDFLRTLVFTLLALEVLIAFAVAVKPLASGRIGPDEALWLMALALIPMLQFALPFAAGFAATIAYYRFAADNESRAAMVGGLAHRQILAPAAIGGTVLAAVLLLLSNQTIPDFLRRMEMLLTRDVIRYVVSTVEGGESLSFDRTNWQMYASGAVAVGPDDDNIAFQRIVFEDVLAIEVERRGEERGAVRSSLYADQVIAYFMESDETDDAAAYMKLQFNNATGSLPGNEIESEQVTSVRIPIPSTFRDDPKFRTFSQLIEMLRDPEQLTKVRLTRRALAREVIRIETMRHIQNRLRADEAVRLRRGDERIILRGRDLTHSERGWGVVARGIAAPIELEWTLADGSQRVQRARRVWIEHGEENEADDPTRAPIVLRMENVVTVDTEGRAADAERETLIRSGVTVADPVRPDLMTMPIDDIVREARDAVRDLETPQAERVRDTAQALKRRADETVDEVLSKLHERFALAAACGLMVLLGAIVGVRRGDALPLQVYLWSFLPAILSLVMIGAGQSLTQQMGSGGLYLLWGGVGVLTLMTVLEYRQFRRH